MIINILKLNTRKPGVKVPDCAAAVIAGTLFLNDFFIYYRIKYFESKYLIASDCCGTTKGSFFMTNNVQGINKMSAGLCPHGMSPGACPICSGMGGGSTRVGERPQKAGEMSYHQCAMIGAMMRAREARIEAHEKNLESRANALKNFEQNLINLAQKMSDFSLKISQNFILKPVAFTINNIVVPIINTVKNIINTIQNLDTKLTLIKEKFVDIQDKLNAIFGEAKAFIEKKVSELVSSIKTKFEGLFKIFKRSNTKDDETKIDEDKKLFNLKTLISKIWKKKEDDTEHKSKNKQ